MTKKRAPAKATKSPTAKKKTSRKTARFAQASSRPTASLGSQGSRKTAENVVRFGTDTVREMIHTGTGEARKAQEKAFAFSREGAQTLSRSADAATRGVQEAIATGREGIEAYVEIGNIAADMTKELSTEVFNYTNNSFSQSVELSKELFSCRTFNDVFELQSRMLQNQLDQFFNETSKLSNMMFRYASEAAEPINERVSDATQRFSKTLTA